MICIVDYGIGNIASIINMYKYLGIQNVIATNDRDQLRNSSKIILPGVGSFDKAINNLKDLDIIDILNEKACRDKIPFLGICLGMQIMTNGSEEGSSKGLGWFDAKVYKFPEFEGLRVPHMGWNYISPKKKSKNIFKKNKKNRFYFAHSYYVRCERNKDVLFSTEYGLEFHSGIIKNNLIGVQFHPEKSLKFGMEFLNYFSSL